MRETEIHDYARQLLEAHGAKAIAEAAQNAVEHEHGERVVLQDRDVRRGVAHPADDEFLMPIVNNLFPRRYPRAASRDLRSADDPRLGMRCRRRRRCAR